MNDDDRIGDPWGPRTPYDRGTPWPVRTDLHLAPGLTEEDVERWVPSASGPRTWTAGRRTAPRTG